MLDALDCNAKDSEPRFSNFNPLLSNLMFSSDIMFPLNLLN